MTTINWVPYGYAEYEMSCESSRSTLLTRSASNTSIAVTGTATNQAGSIGLFSVTETSCCRNIIALTPPLSGSNMRTLYLLILALSAQPVFAAEQSIIARMGDIVISDSDARAIVRSNPTEARSGPGLEKLIQTEIIRRGVAAEARRQSFDQKPEVEAHMQQAAEQALVISYMNSIAQPPADYPSEALLKQSYEANKDALMTPRQYRVSQIYISGSDEKAHKLAEEIAREARRKNADFAALARKASQHAASASKGGDMGWLPENELAPPFRNALMGLSTGEVSAPAAGPEGWHILKLMDRKDPELLPFEKVRDALVRNLRLRQAATIEKAYLDAMLARTPVTVNGIALQDIIKREP